MCGTKFLPGWLSPRQMVISWNILMLTKYRIMFIMYYKRLIRHGNNDKYNVCSLQFFLRIVIVRDCSFFILMQILYNPFPICRPEHSGVLYTTVNGNVFRKIEHNNNATTE